MARRKWADKKVPTKINPNYRRPLALQEHGSTPKSAFLIGDEDGSAPLFVRANGMMVHGIRKDRCKWVTGSGVAAALEAGELVVVEGGDPEAP